MSEAIAWQPLLPLWMIAGGGGVALAALLLSAVRASRLADVGAVLLRTIATIAFIALLLDPQLRTAEEEALNDVAVILVDRSDSQLIDGRAEAARAAADQLKADIETLGGVDIVEVDVAGEDETRLGEALSQAVGATPRSRLSAAVIITDGLSRDEVDPSSLPEEAALHVLFTGRPDEIDRKLTMIDAPRYGIVNQPVQIGFRVEDIGVDGARVADAERRVEVVLRVDGEEVVRQAVPVGAEIRFAAPLARPGETIVELEAAPLAGELSERNNSAVLRIEAIRDRLRTLLISGEPHAGERVWRNLLKSDPAIDLVHFTILRPAEKQASDGVLDQRELALIEFPYDELFIEKLSEFDLVIFDRYSYRGVLNAFHFENIARYVEDGGAVLVSAGPEFSGPLSLAARRNFAYILPVTPIGEEAQGAYRPQVTDDGARHPVVLDLPEADRWGRWLRTQPAAQRGGRALMADGDGRPLLVLDRVGEGRVGALLSDHVWLWARGFDGGGPHAELLRRISHWLMKEPELEEERLILRERDGALVITRRTLAEDASPTELTLPDGSTQTLEMARTGPGALEARLEDPPRGIYRARSDELFAVGEVGLAAPPEFADIAMDRRALSNASQTAGGGTFTLRTRTGGAIKTPNLRRVSGRGGGRAGADWIGLPQRRARRIEAIIMAPIAPPFAWFVAIAAALIGAWALESRGSARKPAKDAS
ncbi:MAG: hypothetical protein AAFX08_01260 [Pseudomonadota bacterium]